MKKTVQILAIMISFGMVACGGDSEEESVIEENIALTEEAVEEATEVESEEESTGTWKEWSEGYNSGLKGSEVTLEGIVEKVTDYQSTDGSEEVMAQFGVDGMMKCVLTAYFNPEMKEALNASRKNKTVISFTGTVDDKSGFDGVKIIDCTINE